LFFFCCRARFSDYALGKHCERAEFRKKNGYKGMNRVVFALLLFMAASIFSLQASAHEHDAPAFVKQAQWLSALINADVYEDDAGLPPAESPDRYAYTHGEHPADARADFEIVNPHGHIHWYKPYFNHTHAGNPNPDHMHWYMQNYVAVDTLEPVTPLIIAASVSPDVL